MKRVLLISIALILTLTLLPTTPIAALKPKPEEKAQVTVNGDIARIELTLDVYRSGKLVVLVGPANFTFEVNLGDFTSSQEGNLGIRIDKRTGEAEIIYSFDRYNASEVDARYVGWFKYQLEGPGTCSGESIPYGTIDVDGEFFTIYQMVYTSGSKKNGKGATHVTYEKVWSGSVSFNVTIDST
jgi:hypothetical protein